MLESCDIMAFVPTTNADGAKRFYRDILGLALVEEDEYACVFRTANAVLRVAITDQVTASSATVLGWVVPDIVVAMRELNRVGVDFVRYEGMGQDDTGMWSAPGGARVAWFRDPDGNLLSLTQL